MNRITLAHPSFDATSFGGRGVRRFEDRFAEMLAGAANLHHAACARRVSAAKLGLPQAKLSRNPNQIARGRIRRFESDMPSQADRSLPANLRRGDRRMQQELHNSAQSVQMWCMLQILAAKLVETWVMLTERFLRSNPPDLVARHRAEHRRDFLPALHRR
jgi:hypothetical protein